MLAFRICQDVKSVPNSSSAIVRAFTPGQGASSSCSTIAGSCLCVCAASCRANTSVRIRTYSGLPEAMSLNGGTDRNADNATRPAKGHVKKRENPFASLEGLDL